MGAGWGGVGGCRREVARASGRHEEQEGFLPSLSRKLTLHSGNIYQEPEGAKQASEDREESVKILTKRQVCQACTGPRDAIERQTHLPLLPGRMLGSGREETSLLISRMLSRGNQCHRQ